MKTYFPLALRIIVAIIIIQTLRFKFFAHPDSVYIFKTIGLEPYGRIAIGVLELIAGSLLFFKKTAWAGALLTLGIIGSAIIIHVTILGIEVKGDGGLLFGTAIVTFILSAIILCIYKKDIPFFKD